MKQVFKTKKNQLTFNNRFFFLITLIQPCKIENFQGQFSQKFYKFTKNLCPHLFLKQFNSNFQEIFFSILKTTCRKRIFENKIGKLKIKLLQKLKNLFPTSCLKYIKEYSEKVFF